MTVPADHPQDRVMLMTAIQTAARRSEIFGLQFQDLDLENNLIRLWTSKRAGGREYDWIPLTATLRRDLLKWIEHRIKLAEVDPNHIFISLDQTRFAIKYYEKPFKNRQHFMKKLCKKAGVPPFGFHSIRHLAAVCLYRQGETVSTIQHFLRHRSATTTARYLKSLGMDVESTRAALEKFSNGPGAVIDLAGKKSKKGPRRRSPQ